MSKDPKQCLGPTKEALVRSKEPSASNKEPSVAVERFETAFSYIIACDQLKSGDEVLNIGLAAPTGDGLPFRELPKQVNDLRLNPVEHLYQKSGICLPLWLVPLGSVIHNIELSPGGGGKLARAAGTYAQLVKKPGGSLDTQRLSQDVAGAYKDTLYQDGRLEHPLPLRLPRMLPNGNPGPQDALTATLPNKGSEQSLCTIRLPSGQQQLLDLRCRATIGVVSNIDHRARILTKAGQRRWLGFRPIVRGVAMNPIDHPHGGGEGRTKGGRPSVSPWGKPSKGGFGAKRQRRRLSRR